MTVPQSGDCHDGTSFNLEAAFADFLANDATELALPQMTVEQRKEAKRLAEQYPDIKCESFGFGEERRLHLFKIQAAPTGLTRIGSEKSTSASEDTPSPANTYNEVHFGSVLSEMVSIRNTFIHVEEEASVEPRMVQSMPHGMFGKCWEEEVVKVKASAGAEQKDHTKASETGKEAPRVAMPPPAKEAPRGIFAPGSDVFVEGLTKCPAFNGLSGKVQSLDKDTGRYDVLLISNSGYQLAKIKGENLRIAVPPPPAQRPEDFRMAPMPPGEAGPMNMCNGFQMPAQPCWYEQHMQPFYAHPDPSLLYAPVCHAR